MFRPVILLVVALVLVVNLVLARTGTGRTQDGSQNAKVLLDLAQPQREEALVQEMKLLRQEIKHMQGQLQSVAKIRGGPLPEVHPVETCPIPGPGKITKIDPADGSLVEVNLGKDSGLEKHNTLEVARAGPNPEFIATLRIVDVYSQRTICRLVSFNPLKKQALQVGDLVSGAASPVPRPMQGQVD